MNKIFSNKFFLKKLKIIFFNFFILLFYLFFLLNIFKGCAFPCKECDINGKCLECFGD